MSGDKIIEPITKRRVNTKGSTFKVFGVEVQPMPARDAVAQAAEGEAGVVIGLRADNGQIFTFAIGLDLADDLKKQLVRARAKTRKEARLTRRQRATRDVPAQGPVARLAKFIVGTKPSS